MSWSSGTNTIQEVDTNKSMTLQMIKLKKQGGGTELFVRKNDVKLGTKSVTKNGTYKASDVGKYGFSQFSVNVNGGNGSSNSSGKPSGIDVTTTKPSGGVDLDGVTPPGGSGSSVFGTDPETGNDVVVGVDEGGGIVKTTVPSAIHIITPPGRTSYEFGDTLSFSGIVVGLRKRDGGVFTDSRYSDGRIPMEELIFPVTAATQSRIPVRWQSVYDGRLLADSFLISVVSGLDIGPVELPLEFSTSGSTIGITRGIASTHILSGSTGVQLTQLRNGNNRGFLFACAESGAQGFVSAREVTSEWTYYLTTTFTHGGKTVYYYYYPISNWNSITSLIPALNGGESLPVLTGSQVAAVAWLMIYGDDPAHTTESGSGGGGSF